MAYDLINVGATRECSREEQVKPTTRRRRHKFKDIEANLESYFVGYVTKVDGQFDEIESCLRVLESEIGELNNAIKLALNGLVANLCGYIKACCDQCLEEVSTLCTILERELNIFCVQMEEV